MPHFCFTFDPPQAGCAIRVCLFTPWTQPARAPNGQPMDPAQQAWAYLQQYANQRDQQGQPALVFPPNPEIKCTCLNPGGTGNQPNVYCIQKADPDIGRAQINAPYNHPVGNGQSWAPPPLPSKERAAPQGAMEDLTDCALSATGDTVFGEMDGAGGTYSDVDSQGREIPRQMFMPPSPKIVGGGR